MPPEHRNDEIPAPELEIIDSDLDDEGDDPTRTRSGRISKPFDYAKEYPDIYGESETIVTESTSNYIEEIQPLDEEEYQLYKEALQWFDFDFNEIDNMMFKTQQMNLQQRNPQVR